MLHLPSTLHHVFREEFGVRATSLERSAVGTAVAEALLTVFHAQLALVAIQAPDRFQKGDGLTFHAAAAQSADQGQHLLSQWQAADLHTALSREFHERWSPLSFSSFSWPYRHLEEGEPRLPREFTLLLPFDSRFVVQLRGDETFAGYVALMFDSFPIFSEELVQLIISLPSVLSEIVQTHLRSTDVAHDTISRFANSVHFQLRALSELLPRLRLGPDPVAIETLSRTISSIELEASSILLGVNAAQATAQFIHSSLNAVIREAAGRYTTLFEGTRVKLALELDPSLPETRLDPLLFLSIIANLLENALKHSSPGSTVTVRTRLESGRTLVLEVTDEGIGLPDAAGELVFSRFFRATADEKTAGLGLFLTKQFVERHGGQLFYYRERDRRTTFVVELPVMREGRDGRD